MGCVRYIKKELNFFEFSWNFRGCLGYMCVSGTSVSRVQVCVGCMCVLGACVCWVHVCVGCKCVGVYVCVGCKCVSDTSVLGCMFVLDTCVCRMQVCVNMRVSLTTWRVITKYISKKSPNSARSSKIPELTSLWPTSHIWKKSDSPKNFFYNTLKVLQILKLGCTSKHNNNK